MAKFSNLVTTNAGLTMIAKAQAGQQLIFTRVKLGDGSIGSRNVATMTDIISPKMSANIQDVTIKAPGHAQMLFAVDNSALDVGFFVREIGIFAKNGENGTEALYAYTNAGDYTDYLSDKNTPLDAIEVKVDIIVGNTTNVAFTNDQTLVYATNTYVDGKISALKIEFENNIKNLNNDITETLKSYFYADAQGYICLHKEE